MLKNILELQGAQELTNKEQKSIIGGKVPTCCLTWNPLTRVCSRWDQACLGQ